MGNIQVTLFSVTLSLPDCPRRLERAPERPHPVVTGGLPSETGTSESDWSVVTATRVIPPRLKVLRVCLKLLIRRKLARAWWRLSEEVKAKKILGISDKRLNLTFGRLGLWLRGTISYRHASAKSKASPP